MTARVMAVALVAALLAPQSALAQHHGGGGPRGGGGGSRGGGAPAARPAARPAPAAGGFNFNRDIGATAHAPVAAARPPVERAAAPPARQAAPAARPPVPQSRPPATSGRPGNTVRAPIVARRTNETGGRPTGGGRQVAIANPRQRGGRAWDWNRGVAWAPAPHYWGGGFWGPFALGASAVAIGALAFGAFDDPADNVVYPSYQVGPDSPGATMLANYQLTQVPCGQPDLVVIFGPDNSVICADPNSLVAPGQYNLDPSTLSLVSQ